MTNFEIENTKEFLNMLFTNDKYDSFYLFELRLKVELDYYISGKLNKGYIQDEMEADTDSDYIQWKDIKGTILGLIKENRLPDSMKLILMFNADNVERLIEMNNLPISPEGVGGLFMNIYLEQGQMQLTTGTSMKVFTLDKTLEQVWDSTVSKYYI